MLSLDESYRMLHSNNGKIWDELENNEIVKLGGAKKSQRQKRMYVSSVSANNIDGPGCNWEKSMGGDLYYCVSVDKGGETPLDGDIHASSHGCWSNECGIAMKDAIDGATHNYCYGRERGEQAFDRVRKRSACC